MFAPASAAAAIASLSACPCHAVPQAASLKPKYGSAGGGSAWGCSGSGTRPSGHSDVATASASAAAMPTISSPCVARFIGRTRDYRDGPAALSAARPSATVNRRS